MIVFGGLLFLAALIAIVIFVILTVMSLIKKDGKTKKRLIGIASSFVVFVVSLIIIATSVETDTESASEGEKTPVSKEEKKDEPTAEDLAVKKDEKEALEREKAEKAEADKKADAEAIAKKKEEAKATYKTEAEAKAEEDTTWGDLKEHDKIVGKSDKDFKNVTKSKPSEVRNDKTGNWRILKIAEDLDIEEYALSYAELYMKDSEVHYIVNFNYNTTTWLNKMGGLLYVEVREYVKREEHDANNLGSGMTLKGYTIYPDGDIEVTY